MSSPEPLIIDFASVDAKNEILKYLKDDEVTRSYSSALEFAILWLDNSVTCFEFTTSGSTGKPKSMSVSRDRIIASIEATASYFNLRRGDKVYVCLSTDFTGGKMMLARALHLGLLAYIVPSSNLDLRLNESFELTAFVPNQLHSIFQSEYSTSFLSNFRSVLVGGASLNNELLGKIKEMEGPEVFETFGMTETLSHIALKRLNSEKFLPFFELLPRIEIKATEQDCLMVKARVTDNEWIKTNDIVEIIDSNHFVWKGRIDNVINSGGIKIYPEEMEKLILPILASINCHSDFYLTSVPDEKLGEKLVLVLEGEEQSPDIILKALKMNLPKYKAPTIIHFKRHFDKTISGKVIRRI